MPPDEQHSNLPFNPMSTDAMFSTILTRLEQQDREAREHRQHIKDSLGDVLTEVKKTNGRVTHLERWRDMIKAKVAVVVFVGSSLVTGAGWLLNHWLSQ
jgi:hypothetical protein